jgi:CHASE1-domain containing sensor protein
LTGIGLDELVQRDAQRQLRRVTAITLVSALTVVVLSTLLFVAINARNEADRQRQQAEGLIEFMLTDLRTRLEGVGRLDVLESVNTRAGLLCRTGRS